MVKSLSPQEKIERIAAEVGTQLHRIDNMVERAEACKHARAALTTMSTQLAEVYRQTALEMLKAGTPHVSVAAQLGVSSHRLYKMKEKSAGPDDVATAKATPKAKASVKPRTSTKPKTATKTKAKTSRTKIPA